LRCCVSGVRPTRGRVPLLLPGRRGPVAGSLPLRPAERGPADVRCPRADPPPRPLPPRPGRRRPHRHRRHPVAQTHPAQPRHRTRRHHCRPRPRPRHRTRNPGRTHPRRRCGMSTHDIHDLLGVGIGPFGLGLAALSEPLADVDAVFVDQRPEFRWHPGMMIEGSTIQVPFLADLVTMADPTSPYSFLNFLKDRRRLYPFYIRESFYPLRAEFDEYCRWVAFQLDSLRWNRRVVSVTRADGIFTAIAEVTDAAGGVVDTETYRARHLVLGVGTNPVLPPALQGLGGEADTGHRPAGATGTDGSAGTAGSAAVGPLIPTADYLDNREALLESGAITIVGSGQSAAEIYRDLIDDAEDRGVRLDWVTRSPRFFPMEYTKLTLEMTSPEYTDHFRALPDDLRDRVGREQRTLYKGISADLVDDIHDALYRLSRGGRTLLTNLISEAELQAATVDPISGEYLLDFRNTALDKTFTRRSGAV